MRLVCGVLQLDGVAASADLLRTMAAQMDVPRLAPSLTLWCDGPVGLALLDFSARGGPAHPLAETTDSTMVADVRLDEPLALARMLGGNESQAADALLLATLERLGPSGIDSVLGDFAFASWDKNAQCLICARDIFGVRPLAYVYEPGKVFAFASLPKALHGSGIVTKKIDEDVLVRRLVLNFRYDDSLIVGIKRLPPGHVMKVSREGLSLWRYWQLNRAAVGTRKCSPEAAAYELRRLVEDAVTCRLPRTNEIGAHLSGGLDSSAIAILAARHLRQQGRVLHAYSFLDRQRSDVTIEDESKFVNSVLEQESGIDWTPIYPSSVSPVEFPAIDVDNMTGLGLEEPENAVVTRAEAQGVGLILTGWGGDEAATFNGRGALAELFLRGRWRILAREIAALGRERGWPASHVLRGEVLSYLWNAILPTALLNFAKQMIGKNLVKGTFDQRILSAEARQRFPVSRTTAINLTADARENRWRLITRPFIALRAEEWAQIGARSGLAFAFPLLDRRVVEFSLSLPSEFFLRGGFRRRLFRDAMADVLPPTVRWRHQKYQPFPSRLIDVATAKDEILAKIHAYKKNKSVCRMINLEHLEREVEGFPSPERVREELQAIGNSMTAAAMIAAMRALNMAEYLEQHGGK